jgi:hypothetical protein
LPFHREGEKLISSSMEFLTPSRAAYKPEFNAPRTIEVSRAIKAKEKPDFLSEFQFAQTVIPLEGGQHRLRLSKPLRLKIGSDLKFDVVDWGIQMDCLRLPELPREVARRFLSLLNAAENEQLTETDQADWVRISDYVDFRQFFVDRSPPRYQEGTLRSKADKCIVIWHDGAREVLPEKAARALVDVNVGERFGAFVKLGSNDDIIGLERVSLLRPASQSPDEERSNWPTKD